MEPEAKKCYNYYMADNTITIYTTPTCGFCHMAKAYLKGKSIPYNEKDITMDRDAMQWVYEQTGQLAVPVLDVNGEVILGFDRPRIDAAIKV
jgi:glutaredoxin 3